jgi:hypothetical protein
LLKRFRVVEGVGAQLRKEDGGAQRCWWWPKKKPKTSCVAAATTNKASMPSFLSLKEDREYEMLGIN